MPDDIPVSIERDGRSSVVAGLQSPQDIADAIRRLEGERDVSLDIRPRGFADRLLVAIDGSHAFLGLVDPQDWGSQFRRTTVPDASQTVMVIGGQTTEIDAHYVVDVPLAARIVGEWLEGTELTVGRWERQ